MQNIQSKATIFFLLVLITDIEIMKIQTSFLEVWSSYLNNSSFCYIYSIFLNLTYILYRLNNFSIDYCFFLLVLSGLATLTLVAGIKLF